MSELNALTPFPLKREVLWTHDKKISCISLRFLELLTPPWAACTLSARASLTPILGICRGQVPKTPRELGLGKWPWGTIRQLALNHFSFEDPLDFLLYIWKTFPPPQIVFLSCY